ncbi:MAG: alginate O-acetyltransferase AlgX-related protein [Thermodesulfobacteriota bacterium]
MGDSFAVSDYQLKTNYHNYLSRALKAGGYDHVEVLNAGMPGMGPGYYWHILNKFGDKWQPDLVLVGFFVGNDFEEYDFIMQRGPFIHEPYDPWRRWLGYLQFRNFWLYKLIRGKLIVARERRRRAQEKNTAKVAREGTFSNQGYLEIEKKRVWVFAKDKQATLMREWREDAAVFAKIQNWCSQRKAPLVFAVFPDQFQVDRNLRQEIYQTYHLRAADFDLAYPNGLIRNYCRQRQLHCLDMLGPFQKLGASQTLYKLRDSHWNAAGNRLAADLIFKYLTAHRLVGPRKREAALKAGVGSNP